MGAEHLLGLGHHRIAYFDGDMTVEQLGGRRNGFMEVMAEAGVPVDPDLVAAGLSTRMEARRCMRAMFDLPRTQWPTAIFVPRTVLIDGVMDAVQAAGLRVPDDVSIMGFSAVPEPAFTSICAPLEEIGERAVEHLIETVESGPRDDGARQVTFGVLVVDRGTTAPPKA
jgi:LacI family transcriptional regulator